MNIKQSIGNRITSSRKELGITIKELAARTETLSAARISNWEQGTRSPGPLEAKTLAKVLGVSPSYILCLSDDPRGDLHIQADVFPRFIPLLRLEEVNMTKARLEKIISELSPLSEDISKVTLDDDIKQAAGPNTFATKITDTSMSPVFGLGDTVIADPDKKPNPGQYVIAHIKSIKENIVRKYREPTASTSAKNGFELVPLNLDWGTIKINGVKDGVVVATLIEHRVTL